MILVFVIYVTLYFLIRTYPEVVRGKWTVGKPANYTKNFQEKELGA